MFGLAFFGLAIETSYMWSRAQACRVTGKALG